MASKSESTFSKAELLDLLDACKKFKDKVDRDAPKCFKPSPQLKRIFDLLESKAEA